MKTSKLKKKIVRNVFDKVHDNYDLMNDIMSFGSHRLWKKELVKIINASQNDLIIDMASGTGDISKIICNKYSDQKIMRIDPNYLMLKKGSDFFKKNKKIIEICSTAENIPLSNNLVDTYVISFGIRNTYDTQKALNEAYRVTKKGGNLCVWSFIKLKNQY